MMVEPEYLKNPNCPTCTYFSEDDNYCAYSYEGWCGYKPIEN